jgi:hypothetical protein
MACVSHNTIWNGKMLISTCVITFKRINDHLVGNECQMPNIPRMHEQQYELWKGS